MNRTGISKTFLGKLATAFLLGAALAATPTAARPAIQQKPAASGPKQTSGTPAPRRAPAGTSGEDFYIVVSVNQAQKSLVLKLPTEVTTVMRVNDQTVYLDENGRRIGFADLHAGDTVYATHQHPAGNEEMAVRIRKGPMTVQELHRRYVPSS